MPTITSAKKRLRQNVKRRATNRSQMSALRTQMKQMRTTIDQGDKEAAEKALSTTCKALDQAAAKGLIKKNATARRKSRLAKKVNGIGNEEA